MLKKLSYSVTFPTTGRTLAGEFCNSSRVWAHYRRQRAEKKPHHRGGSLVLFGSSALRGKVEDYKTLRATLQVSARGQTYVVAPTRRRS